jgi:hypothetical protein
MDLLYLLQEHERILRGRKVPFGKPSLHPENKVNSPRVRSLERDQPDGGLSSVVLDSPSKPIEKGIVMKLNSRHAVFCVAVLLLRIPLGAQAPSTLETTGVFPGGGYRWISAEAAASAEKIIDLDLVGSDSLRRTVEKQRQVIGERVSLDRNRPGDKPLITTIPVSECKSMTMVADGRGGFGSSATLADLSSNSATIVQGTIRTVDLGFAFGTPTSLLGVEVSTVLKGASPKSPFYIDYPVAHFRIGPLSFCNSASGFEPSPGDQIILFAYKGPVDKEGILYAPRIDQLIFQSQKGTVVFPERLSASQDVTWAHTLDSRCSIGGATERIATATSSGSLGGLGR